MVKCIDFFISSNLDKVVLTTELPSTTLHTMHGIFDQHAPCPCIVQPPTWEGKKLEESEAAWLLEVFF